MATATLLALFPPILLEGLRQVFKRIVPNDHFDDHKQAYRDSRDRESGHYNVKHEVHYNCSFEPIRTYHIAKRRMPVSYILTERSVYCSLSLSTVNNKP